MGSPAFIHTLRSKLSHIWRAYEFRFLIAILFLTIIGATALIFPIYFSLRTQTQKADATLASLQKAQKDLEALKSQDQYKRNETLQKTIGSIEDTYSKAVTEYQDLLDLKTQVKDTSDYDKLFAESLSYLAKRNYASASSDLKELSDNIASKEQEIAAQNAPNTPNTTNVPASNNPPGSGYSRQSVTTDTGTFVADIIAADLNSTRVIVDTASDSDCSNNCPTLPLLTYVSRSGAYAGINGTFFCPLDYPSCAGKTGSFDTLLMNKNKVYFNSTNNVYSTVPLVYTNGSEFGVRTHSSDWGRTTGVDSVIAMQPLLILSGQIVYGSSSDTKFTNKGTRNFIAHKGSTVYIGTIYNANMTDSAHTLKALGMDDALNLDEGGSTALIYNGTYINGPGRNIPNAVLFVRK